MDYAKDAKLKIEEFKKKNNDSIPLTTTQLRKILFLINAMSNKLELYLSEGTGNEDIKEINDELNSMLINLKVKIAYQIGKEKSEDKKYHRSHFENFEKIVSLTGKADKIIESKKISDLKDLINYCEALVAYHKFYGGK